ncbi:MAG: hypothetical protein KDK70_33555 [Myxococcales bacterium]|nr:hypothetical protein [Myxococcales bacterium]
MRHRARPRDYWSWCAEPLREAFEERCGWAAMFIADGCVDHFVSWDECKRRDPGLAYEWSNYRYVTPRLNSRKRHLEGLLDPFEVGPGWFRVELPSLLLVCTDQIPPEQRARAQQTIERLGLVGDRDPKIRRLRAGWLRRYRDDLLTLAGLGYFAPLVGQAVAALLDAEDERLDPVQREFRGRLLADRRAAGGTVP